MTKLLLGTSQWYLTINDKIYCLKNVKPHVNNLQSNFNGSNTFGTMKISSRQGYFEPTRVDYSARSGGLIGIFF